MKIGILTYPLNNNYGCYMQSFALLTFLKERGYDVEYIFRRHDKPSIIYYLKYSVKSILKTITTFRFNSIRYNYEYEYMIKKGQNMLVFFETYIQPHTEIIYTTRKLKKICQKYDAIIVGSDQVWRAEILSNVEDYFLSFLSVSSSVKRIAYAASFGKSDPGYTRRQIKRCGRAISYFSDISIREDAGVSILKKYDWTCPEPHVVLDPTMLLKKECYYSLIKKRKYKETILGYILDQSNDKQRILKQVSEHFSVASCNFLENVKKDDFIFPSIVSWLGMLASSRFVVTDSFHGAVFSIILNKPFVVVVNERRGAARFETLLNKFNLYNRMLNIENNVYDILNNDINWEDVNNILNKEREKSINFLIESLK